MDPGPAIHDQRRRSLGQYATPVATVDYMVSRALALAPKTHRLQVLDPAAGDGVFVERLLARGVPASDIHAMDIDPSVVDRLKRLCHAEQGDFLCTAGRCYDIVIGNPPYKSKRQSSYIRSRRKALEQQFADVGVQNLYAMFVVQALANLREGGILCFIVQDSFLTNVYYRRFRQFLLDNCRIHEITLAPRTLFHGTDADVRTAILVLEKCTGLEREAVRRAQPMRLVDRLASEAAYNTPPAERVQVIAQQHFAEMDQQTFFVNVPMPVLDLLRTAPRTLGDVVRGGTGISTGNDTRYLQRVDRPEFAPGAAEADEWVPFYKNGGASDAWYYDTPYRIRRDWKTPASRDPNFIARNTAYYFRAGITCSSMGAAFSAAYLPPGCLFGVNANFFCDTDEDLFYVLGLLNSQLAQYLVRAVLNRTNMVTAGYLKRIPYVEPDERQKQAVADLSRSIVEARRANRGQDLRSLAAEVNQRIFDIYGLSGEAEAAIRRFCANVYESM
ncbi:MAG: N-6 DNA methylase [Alicyclobacillus sp.]|nr:N-6 DNA methylase [Alicyclobacillus sp.]